MNQFAANWKIFQRSFLRTPKTCWKLTCLTITSKTYHQNCFIRLKMWMSSNWRATFCNQLNTHHFQEPISWQFWTSQTTKFKQLIGEHFLSWGKLKLWICQIIKSITLMKQNQIGVQWQTWKNSYWTIIIFQQTIFPFHRQVHKRC